MLLNEDDDGENSSSEDAESSNRSKILGVRGYEDSESDSSSPKRSSMAEAIAAARERGGKRETMEANRQRNVAGSCMVRERLGGGLQTENWYQ